MGQARVDLGPINMLDMTMTDLPVRSHRIVDLLPIVISKHIATVVPRSDSGAEMGVGNLSDFINVFLHTLGVAS